MSSSLLYITLPRELADQIHDFPFDSSIPLPVEVPPEERESWDVSRLTWPSLLSGMVKAVTEKPQGRDADYYRRLTKTVKPDIVATLLTTAELKTEQGEFTFAESLFLSLCALEPDKKIHRDNLKLFYRKKEDRLLRDDVNYSRALAFIREKKADKAESSILLFLNKNPESSNGWFLLGWSLRLQEKWEEALDAFDRVRSLGDPTKEVFNEMALCYSELEQLERAADSLRKALGDGGDDPMILSNLAMVYLRMNDLSRAEDTMLILREIDPDDPLVQQFFSED